MKAKTFPLPKGAKPLNPPVRRAIGAWTEMEFDAFLTVFGMRWLRVKGGFGRRGDREDWVADIPGGTCLSVSDYNWNGSDFGTSYPSFIEAIKGETRIALVEARDKLRKLEAKVAAQIVAITNLRATTRKMGRAK